MKLLFIIVHPNEKEERSKIYYVPAKQKEILDLDGQLVFASMEMGGIEKS